MPTVSIITPCYNQGHYLGEAIESVLAQSFTDYEHIIIDDGSSDSTSSIASQYDDKRICYYYQENAGLAKARNNGIKVASGRYLAFLDSDDRWNPEFLSICVEALQHSPAYVVGVYTGHQLIDSNGVQLPKIHLRTVPPEQLRSQLLRSGFFPPCAVLIRAGIVRGLDCFDENLQGRGTEDWDLWLRVTEKNQLIGLPKTLAQYRVAPSSMSNNLADMQACRISVLEKHFGPLDKNATNWTSTQREVYSFAYRAAAFDYFVQGDRESGWQHLTEAVQLNPSILIEKETYYELACDDQPRMSRGDASQIDFSLITAEIVQRLTECFEFVPQSTRYYRVKALAQLYLTLALLAEQAENQTLARKYLVQAITLQPSLLRSSDTFRQMARLIFSREVLTRMMRLGTQLNRANSI